MAGAPRTIMVLIGDRHVITTTNLNEIKLVGQLVLVDQHHMVIPPDNRKDLMGRTHESG